MVRDARRRSSEDDGDDEADPDTEDGAAVPRGRHRSARPTRSALGSWRSIPRWRGPAESDDGGDDGDEEPDEAPRSRWHLRRREKPPVYWRARDSLYFEPLVALAIIVVLIVGLYAYTQNWPPVYVVESQSMQHGTTDILGLVNTGDLVLAQKVDTASVVPYVVGVATGYQTYGEYGDVLLYHPNGGGGTPIIHRAIAYLQWNGGSYSVPDLNGLPCGSAANAVYSTPGTPNSCGTSGLTGTLELYRVGWMNVNVSVDLSSPALGGHSGFLTMGDNNFNCAGPGDCLGSPDQMGGVTPAISQLVEPGWVLGVARGMIPWFGAVKLLFEGNAAEVPTQSWEFLGLTIAGVILLAFGIHYALRAEGVETDLRRREEEAQETEPDDRDDEADGPERRPSRSLRAWRRPPSDTGDPTEGAMEVPPPSATPEAGPRPGRRGRPRPRVRRSHRSSRPARDEDL